jgi:hypothetical protein
MSVGDVGPETAVTSPSLDMLELAVRTVEGLKNDVLKGIGNVATDGGTLRDQYIQDVNDKMMRACRVFEEVYQSMVQLPYSPEPVPETLTDLIPEQDIAPAEETLAEVVQLNPPKLVTEKASSKPVSEAKPSTNEFVIPPDIFTQAVLLASRNRGVFHIAHLIGTITDATRLDPDDFKKLCDHIGQIKGLRHKGKGLYRIDRALMVLPDEPEQTDLPQKPSLPDAPQIKDELGARIRKEIGQATLKPYISRHRR